MDFLGSGDTSQQDCVDEATNTTSYLLVLERNGLIQRHLVERPFAKDDGPIGRTDQGKGKWGAVRHRFLGQRQWRESHGAISGEFLCA
jgi:hypothetical protein